MVFRFRLTSMMCQMQNTIIAQSASPVSSGIQLMRLDNSPNGMRTTMPINDAMIRFFMMVVSRFD